MDECVLSLVCQENETSLEEEVVDEGSFVYLNDDSVSEDEYVDILIERETALGFKRDESLVCGNWIKLARLDAINWILNVSPTTNHFIVL